MAESAKTEREPADAPKGKPKGDREFLRQARKRFDRAMAAEQINRKDALDDLKFKKGEQWPEAIRSDRTIQKRPCLTVNKMKTFVHQITNDQRQNRPAINVSPVGDKSDPNTAKMLKGLINGSAIQLIGTDNIDSVLGTNPVGCVFSEYSIQDPKAWDYIRPILRENGGWAIFDYTPRGKNHGYQLYQMARSNPDWYAELLTITDTKALDETSIDKERREGMSEELIQQEYYCSFEGVAFGSYFGPQLKQAENDKRITKVPYEAELGVETWWDLGVRDSTSIWFTQTVGREIRLIDYYENSGEGLPHYAKVLQGKPYVYSKHHAPHDIEVRELGSGRSRKEIAASLGIVFEVVPNLALEDGIEAARAILSRCWFDQEKCTNGLNALASYHKEWDERLKIWRANPCHDWSSHAADAFRMLAVGHKSATVKTQAPEIQIIGYDREAQNLNWLAA